MASKHLYATKLTTNDSSAREQLGTIRREWSSTDECFKTYKYVQASLTEAASNGICLAFYDTKGQVATDDISTANANQPAGVATGTLTNNYYGWIQIGGLHTAVDTTGDGLIAAGDFVHLQSDTDGKSNETAAGTASSVKILGVAVEDEASSTAGVMLDCKYGDVMATKSLFGAACSVASSTAENELGTIRKEWDDSDQCLKTYRYVQASLSATAADGVCLACYNQGCTVVTDDISTSKQGLPAGVAVGAITNNYYAWVQIGGYHPEVDTNGDDDISDGDTLILSSTDKKCDSVASGTASTYKPLGIAVAADVDAADTVAALLTCDYGYVAQ